MTSGRDWRAEAACLGTDLRLWFPLPSAYGVAYERARAICDGCPVRTDCLAVALAGPPEGDVGIWAGTSPDERAALRDDRDIVWDDQMPRI